MWSLEFVEVADDELITKKLSERFDGADIVSRDSSDRLDKVVSRPVNIAPSSSSVTNRHVNLGNVGEYSSSVDSDTGHMQYAIDNWLSAEKQQRSGDDDTSQVSRPPGRLLGSLCCLVSDAFLCDSVVISHNCDSIDKKFIRYCKFVTRVCLHYSVPLTCGK